LTGEGKFDAQSAYGKVPMGVAHQGSNTLEFRSCVVIAGSVLPSAEILHREGVAAYFSILNRPMRLEDAMKNGAELVENQTAEVVRLFSAASGLTE
jgi:glycerate kinase